MHAISRPSKSLGLDLPGAAREAYRRDLITPATPNAQSNSAQMDHLVRDWTRSITNDHLESAVAVIAGESLLGSRVRQPTRHGGGFGEHTKGY